MLPPGNEPYPYWGHTWTWPKKQVRNRKSTTIASRKKGNLAQLPPTHPEARVWRGQAEVNNHSDFFQIPLKHYDSTVEERWNRSVKCSFIKSTHLLSSKNLLWKQAGGPLDVFIWKHPLQNRQVYTCLLLIITCWPQWLFLTPCLELWTRIKLSEN